MSGESSEPGGGIRAGDRVRALEGTYKGKVGTVLRVVTSRDEGRTSRSVLVSFPAGGADFLDVCVLEKSGRGETAGE